MGRLIRHVWGLLAELVWAARAAKRAVGAARAIRPLESEPESPDTSSW